MSLKVCLFVTVLCGVISLINCDRYNNRQYVRMKRGKFYSNSPPKFYSRPPPSFPSREVVSYTPPPNYAMEDEDPPYPGNSRPPKVSRRPNKGLGEEDLNNLVKYLSKQDLDKLLQYAGKGNSQYEKNYEYKSVKNELDFDPNSNKYNQNLSDDDNFFKSIVQQIDSEMKTSSYKEADIAPIRNYAQPTPPIIYSNPPNVPPLLSHQEPIYSTPPNFNDAILYTDSKIMPEEELPKPINLREESDYEVSFSKNVPTVVKTDPSYEIKNFGELPLMNYHSKLDTLSSYHVPHYTITSPNKPSSSYSSPHVPLETAPPPSAAQSQSDAHLKAVKIWSHRSQGTAYTLHDDGTLSLEKPTRPKSYYGHP